MVQFRVLSGKQAGRTHDVQRLPFVVGRLPTAGLSLDEPGVWDQHLQVEFEPGKGVVASVQPQALAVLNGQPLQRSVLRNGDIIQMGAVKVQFWLSPTRQKSYRFWENAIWVGLAVLCATQILVIYQLLR